MDITVAVDVHDAFLQLFTIGRRPSQHRRSSNLLGFAYICTYMNDDDDDDGLA